MSEELAAKAIEEVAAKLDTARAAVVALNDRAAFLGTKAKSLVYPVAFEHDQHAAAELAEVDAELARTNALLAQAGDAVTDLAAELAAAQAAQRAALIGEGQAARDESEARIWDALIEVITANEALQSKRAAYTARVEELYTAEKNLRALGADLLGWQKPLRDSELTREYAESRRKLLRQRA